MPKRSTFTLEMDEIIRDGRMKSRPTTWKAIGLLTGFTGEACRNRYHDHIKSRPSYKACLELLAEGLSQTAVAKKLCIPLARVEWWLRRSRGYGTKPAKRQEYEERECLKCRRLFASEGKHNRVCSACKLTSSWQSGSDWATPFSTTRR